MAAAVKAPAIDWSPAYRWKRRFVGRGNLDRSPGELHRILLSREKKNEDDDWHGDSQ